MLDADLEHKLSTYLVSQTILECVGTTKTYPELERNISLSYF